jgi:hypothetical protein
MNHGWTPNPSQHGYIDQYLAQQNHGVVDDAEELRRLLSNALTADYSLEPVDQQPLDTVSQTYLYFTSCDFTQ